MGQIEQLWSLPMGAQIRMLKASVDAHGRAEISNRWEEQKNRTQRGWKFRIRSWRPGPKPLSPKCQRLGAFGTRDTRKFIGSNLKDTNDETAFKVFQLLARTMVEGKLRQDDPNKIDGLVIARNNFEAVVEVWLPILATDTEVRENLMKRLRRLLKKEVGLERNHYECHILKSDKFYGYVFDGTYWSNPLREGTKAWFERKKWEKEQAALEAAANETEAAES